jgi:glycosyltransferase involved in cell wall biosynthesis
VLWLTPFAPWPPHGGGKIRTTNLVRRVVAAGDRVELWSVTDESPGQPDPPVPGLIQRYFTARSRSTLNEKVAGLASKLPTSAWQLRSPDALKALNEAKGFDIAVVDTALSGAFIPELEAARLPFVFDAMDVAHSVLHQIAGRQRNPVTRFRFEVDAVKSRVLESVTLKKAAAVVAVSDADARALEHLAPGVEVTVHRNGVDLSQVQFVDHTQPRGARLLMTGTLAYYPNVDATLWFIREILPLVRRRLPAATLTLVGGPVPADLLNLDPDATGVRVVGPRPDMRPFMEEADLFVIPLRLGGGTRVKAVEALAGGLPIVSTPLGVTGLDIIERDLALLADTPEHFAAAIQRGLSDLELRKRLVFEGRGLAEDQFDFDRIGAAFRATLNRVLAGSG